MPDAAGCYECGVPLLSGVGHCPECTDRLYEKPSEIGCQTTSGIVGARGRLTHVSETLGLPPTDVSTTPGDGLKVYPGRVTGILSRWREGPGGGYILTAYFDSQTERFLKDAAFGRRGSNGTVGVGFSLTMQSGERFTT